MLTTLFYLPFNLFFNFVTIIVDFKKKNGGSVTTNAALYNHLSISYINIYSDNFPIFLYKYLILLKMAGFNELLADMIVLTLLLLYKHCLKY